MSPRLLIRSATAPGVAAPCLRRFTQTHTHPLTRPGHIPGLHSPETGLTCLTSRGLSHPPCYWRLPRSERGTAAEVAELQFRTGAAPIPGSTGPQDRQKCPHEVCIVVRGNRRSSEQRSTRPCLLGHRNSVEETKAGEGMGTGRVAVIKRWAGGHHGEVGPCSIRLSEPQGGQSNVLPASSVSRPRSWRERERGDASRGTLLSP